MSIYSEYMSHMRTLETLRPPGTGRVAVFILLMIVSVVGLGLWFTPWVQTAQGLGVVSTLDAQNRTQAISALVPGQIKQWHVQEGQQVKEGDPIVTLVDQDESLLVRLQAELEAKVQERNAGQSALQTAEQDLLRRRDLLEQGIVSQRDLEQAQLRVDDLRAKLASVQAELNRAEVNLARQSTQTKKAPQDGVIVRLHSAGLATFVSPGDVLATFIPDEVERAVLLEVNGLDAPLVQSGRKVRLQFDGWPVFQFSGWPSTAVGTFGGVVTFVEPIATERGRFRVWIVQDPDDKPWPKNHYVRLGSQARGWVLLEEVQLGYEIWRQLNNFPPNYPTPEQNHAQN